MRKVSTLYALSLSFRHLITSHQAGANVALLYNTGADEATAHASKLESTYKVKIRTYQCDTTKPERSAEVIELAAKDFGRLDVLVCNAGVCKHVCLLFLYFYMGTKSIWIAQIDAIETPEDIVDWTLGVNVKGVFFLCQAAAK